jgi:F-type H+-transporting ATPase subunit b
MLKIPPDYTVLVQIVVFVVLWVVLKRLWFDPALRVIHERTARSEGAVREARAVQTEAERLRLEHSAALDEVRAAAQREMHDMVCAAEAEQKRLVAEAREQAQRTLAGVRSQVAEEVARARQGLRDQAGEIARDVARKVLGRAV